MHNDSTTTTTTTPTPREVWDGLSPDDQRRVRDFTPGIWDARSIFEEYTRLSDLFALDGKVWRFTPAGAAVFAYATTEIEQFYCEGCKSWLTEGGTVHNYGEHEGAAMTRRWRYSYDGGETWQDEPREEPVGMGAHLSPKYPEPNRKDAPS